MTPHPDTQKESGESTSALGRDSRENSRVGAIGGAIAGAAVGAILGPAGILGGVLFGGVIGDEYERRIIRQRELDHKEEQSAIQPEESEYSEEGVALDSSVNLDPLEDRLLVHRMGIPESLTDYKEKEDRSWGEELADKSLPELFEIAASLRRRRNELERKISELESKRDEIPEGGDETPQEVSEEAAEDREASDRRENLENISTNLSKRLQIAAELRATRKAATRHQEEFRRVFEYIRKQQPGEVESLSIEEALESSEDTKK